MANARCINEDGQCHFRARLQHGVRNGQKRPSLEDHVRKGTYWCRVLGIPGPPLRGRSVLHNVGQAVEMVACPALAKQDQELFGESPKAGR